MSADKFVFVVCGAREHIDTLHFSIRALKKFSRNDIILVTDSSRNEVPVVHDEIINIQTPKHFSHHQASIYLKTGLNKFLPKGYNYCYLDTDVVALDNKVDDIFKKFEAPVTFCTDHCVLAEFSPSAISCGCFETFQKDQKKPYYYADDFRENVLPKLLYIDKCVDEIDTLIEESKSSKWVYYWHRFRYWLPGKYYRLNDQYKMDKAQGIWYDRNGTPLRYNSTDKDDILYTAEKTGFSYKYETQQWYRPDGTSLTRISCGHLQGKLIEKFGVHVNSPLWQHWNGGVFLFNDTSTDFLEYWHKTTMAIFEDKEWKTRDQGTLVATVWKFGLKDHVTLPISYNLIADYNNETIEYLGDLTFKVGIAKKIIKPHFIHLYHHWGDRGWDVWRDVEKYIAAQ